MPLVFDQMKAYKFLFPFAPEKPATWPKRLIAKASLSPPPGKEPRPCMPVALVHRKASSPIGVLLDPTTSPDALMALAELSVPPGSVPRLRGLPVVHSTAE